MSSASGDSQPQRRLIWKALATKAAAATATNAQPSPAVIAPRGSSRLAVRGFFASKRASTMRLKPIAALRAATMQARIQANCRHDGEDSRAASSAPVKANGSANTVWLTRTNERYVPTDAIRYGLHGNRPR